MFSSESPPAQYSLNVAHHHSPPQPAVAGLSIETVVAPVKVAVTAQGGSATEAAASRGDKTEAVTVVVVVVVLVAAVV